MSPEEIVSGETYIDDYDSERTVLEIRPGLQEWKKHIMYVRYTIPNGKPEGTIVKLKDFAFWAKEAKEKSEVHICKEKKKFDVKNTFIIQHQLISNRWLMRGSYRKTQIIFCPFCGMELPLESK